MQDSDLVQAAEGLIPDAGDPVSRQIQTLEFFEMHKDIVWQLGDFVASHGQDFQFFESVEGGIGDGSDFVRVQLQRAQSVLVSECFVLGPKRFGCG